jgi:hypothetical protein
MVEFSVEAMKLYFILLMAVFKPKLIADLFLLGCVFYWSICFETEAGIIYPFPMLVWATPLA